MTYPYYTIEIVSLFPYTEPHFAVTTFLRLHVLNFQSAAPSICL
jgi:hypothetical protein